MLKNYYGQHLKRGKLEEEQFGESLINSNAVFTKCAMVNLVVARKQLLAI